MWIEITRLALGLMIAFFHRPIADFLLHQERAVVIAMRQRGIPYPPTASTETTRTAYFSVGIILAMFEIVRIWMMLHPASPISALFVR